MGRDRMSWVTALLLVGLSSACTGEPQQVVVAEPASAAVESDDIPCPSCALTVDRTIRGTLEVNGGYGASQVPLRCMKQ